MCLWRFCATGVPSAEGMKLHQEEGLYFLTVFSADLKWVISIYIGLEFCYSNYVFCLGMPASGIENNRQNAEAVNFLRHVEVEEHRGERGDAGSRELTVPSARVLWGIQGLFLTSAFQQALLDFYYSVCAMKLESANCVCSSCCNLEKGMLLRRQCVYQTFCTISGRFGFLLMELDLIFTFEYIWKFFNILQLRGKKISPVESLTNCVNILV